jgi:hypothetical protein
MTANPKRMPIGVPMVLREALPGAVVINLWQERYVMRGGHTHPCPVCYEYVPCDDVCDVEVDELTYIGTHAICDRCRVTNLLWKLKRYAAVETGPFFMGWPDRWYEPAHWRCVNDHVSSRFLITEKGDRCLGCFQRITLTFPEDTEGPLYGPNMDDSFD